MRSATLAGLAASSALFIDARSHGEAPAPPANEIEMLLHNRQEFARNLFGAHNSETPTWSCAGIQLRMEPDRDYGDEIEQYLCDRPSDAPPDLRPPSFDRPRWTTSALVQFGQTAQWPLPVNGDTNIVATLCRRRHVRACRKDTVCEDCTNHDLQLLTRLAGLQASRDHTSNECFRIFLDANVSHITADGQ